MKVNIKLLNDKAIIPKKAHLDDAAFDLTITSIKKKGFFKVQYGFGIATELPKEHYAKVYSRSSVHKTFMWLANGLGIIDNSYRGEWMAVFYKIPFISKPYKVGDRCCQFTLETMLPTKIHVVDELSDTERSLGGFGSTGN